MIVSSFRTFRTFSAFQTVKLAQNAVRSDREAKIVARIAKVVHWRGSELNIRMGKSERNQVYNETQLFPECVAKGSRL